MTNPPQWTRETEDRVVRAVLLDRARRWGFSKHLRARELERWVTLQEHSKGLRADVRAMLTTLSNAGRLERDATIMLTVETATNVRRGCGKIRLDHGSAPFGPHCLLEADHVGPCEWPYPFDHAHKDGKCVAPPPHGGVE